MRYTSNDGYGYSPSLSFAGTFQLKFERQMGIFNEEWQVSYNTKAPKSIPPGRFNKAGEAMFYSAMEDQFGDKHLVAVLALECNKEFFFENNKEPAQY